MDANERVYRQRLLRRTAEYFRPGMHVLDAGCGPGAGAEMLAELGCRVTAVDIGEYATEWERRAPLGIRFERGSAEQLSFPDAAFDAVWIMDALHHMAWPEKAMAEVLRVAKPGAPVVVVETNRRSPLTFVRMTLIAGHQTFGRTRLVNMFRRLDPGYRLFTVETRCLPWSRSWVLRALNVVSDALESVPFFHPWLTYHVAVLRGAGRAVEPPIDPKEPLARREARVHSEAIACRKKV